MKTLVVYDNTGYLVSVKNGEPAPREPVGIPFLWVEVPKGKYVVSIDVSGETHIPIFDDLPKTETQMLQEQVDDLNLAIAALMGGAV